jgi:hypothetical protein
MKFNICFYTNQKFRFRESVLSNYFKNIGFNEVYPYRSENVKTGIFYEENKEILDNERGDGYWLWKPKIILDSLEKMEYGDVLVYTDAGDELLDNILYHIKNHVDTYDYYFTNWGGDRWYQKICTKRDCFILMGCDEEVYHNTPQMEAGFIIVKKTDQNITFINEYFYFCKNKNIITDIPNEYGENFHNWQFHRHDQSILTNLIVKNNYSFFTSLDDYIKNNIHLV